MTLFLPSISQSTMSKSNRTPPPGIDLSTATVGDRFVLRDGTPVQYIGKAPPSAGERAFKFKTLNTDVPHECFRTRDGRFSTSDKHASDPRDITEKLAAHALDIDLTNAQVGAFFRRRNGANVWLKQIRPANVEFRWVVGDIPYRKDGTHLLNGGFSPLDLVESQGFTPSDQKKEPVRFNLEQLPLGQKFKRRDGKEVRFTSRDGELEKWPFIVGGESYTVEGCYMNIAQESNKDLVEAIPLETKGTAMTSDDAFEALLRIAEQQEATACKRITGLVEFLKRDFLLKSK